MPTFAYAHRFLPQDKQNELLLELAKTYEVHVPAQQEKEIHLAPLNEVGVDNMLWDYELSMYSFKAIFLPAKDKLFDFDQDGIRIPEETAKALVGIHLEDLHAMRILDRALLGQHPDANYARRRQMHFIVGISKSHYSQDSFTPYRSLDLVDGYDLFLQQVEGSYLVVPGSERGNQFATAAPFMQPTELTLPEPTEPLTKKHVLKDPARLQTIVEQSISDEFWNTIASTCIGCGNCTFVCPLCYCFDVIDENSLEPGKGARYRTWDSCLFGSFTKVAGDEVFRKTIAQRYYNWYHHKFVRMPDEVQNPGCVGCGRCTTYCPAMIDIHRNLENLLNQYGEQA